MSDTLAALEPKVPHNMEAEQALLGAILVNNDAANFIPGLRPEHFYDELHERLFQKTMEIIDGGGKVTPVVLAPLFETDPGIQQIGGTQYLAVLAASAITIINAPDYARIITECWQRREMIGECRLAIGACDDGANPQTIADELGEQLSRLTEENDVAAPKRPSAESILDHLHSGTSNLIPTGIRLLDERIMGLGPGQVIVVGARTSMGKSALAQQLTLSFAQRRMGVAFFSCEMTAAEVTERLLSRALFETATRIPYQNMQPGQLNESELKALTDAGTAIAKLPILIADNAGQSMIQIRGRVRRMVRWFERENIPLKLVVIDYLQRLRVGPEYLGKRVYELQQITSACKDLAKEFGVTVLLLSQLSRAVENREDRRPLVSDLRDSGSIEEDADTILLLYRKEYYLDRDQPDINDVDAYNKWLKDRAKWQGKCEISYPKVRGRETGTVLVDCDIGHCFFGDLERRYG